MKDRNFFHNVVGLLTLMALPFLSMAQKSPLERSRSLKISKNDSIQLVNTWNSFLSGIQKKEFAKVKELSLEKVYCKGWCNVLPGKKPSELMLIDSFLSNVITKFYDSRFFGVLNDSSFHVMEVTYPDRKPLNYTIPRGQSLVLYDVYYVDYVPQPDGFKDQNYYVFRFVRSNNEYKFFGISLECPH